MVVIRHQVDDREGCRSLVCDANGIIVAEMVYRCMICTTVSDCIADAQKHYRSKHMDTIGHDDEPMVSYEDEDADESMVGDVHDLPESSDELGAADRATLTFSHPSGLKKLQSTAGDSDDEGPTTPLPAAGNGRGTRGGGGFQAAPDPAGDGSNTRGGYVTCAVCNITKFYASVQRRYGQFTCMGCAKFFGRFLLKPRKYCCPNLASCPLDVSPRCKACLLLACINTYTIDEKRMSVVDGHRPLKKTAVTASATSGNPSSLSGYVTDKMMDQSTGVTSSAVSASSSSTTSCLSNCTASSSTLLSNGTQSTNDLKLVITSNNASTTQQRSLQSTLASSRATAGLGDQRQPSPAPLRQPLPRVRIRTRPLVKQFVTTRSTLKGQKGCRKCTGCLVQDCGKCIYCLDKPKHGGPNTLKKKCIKRRCSLITTVNKCSTSSRRERQSSRK